MRIKIDKTIVPYKLARELRAAGITLKRDVVILLRQGVPHGLEIPLVDETQEDVLLPTIEAVIAAHDGVDDVANLEADAEARIKNIPGWATWDEATALDWFTTHIDNLTIPADVKTLLKAYGRVLLALRDKTWPELNKE